MNAVIAPSVAESDTWQTLATALQNLQTPNVDADAIAMRSVVMPPIIIIGAGPSAQECARQMSLSLTDEQWILLINGEHYFPYNRAQLSSVLAAGRNIDNLIVRDFGRSIQFLHAFKIASVDRRLKCLIAENGIKLFYQTLIFATGSTPRRPHLPGLQGPRVLDFRQLHDLEKIVEFAPERIAVLGGGLLGIEAARAMQRYCHDVTVLEKFPHLLARQLDLGAGARLAEHLIDLGLHVYTGVKLLSAECTEHSVILVEEGGTRSAFDLVICATGIRANTDLAKASGLICHSGIAVDDQQKTSDPDVYAIGECCERNGHAASNLGISLEHARRAARSISNQALPPQSTTEVFQLKVDSCVAVAVGQHRPQDATQIVYAADERNYLRVIVDQKKVVGAILFGDATLDFSAFLEAVETELPWTPEIEKCFLRTGKLPRIATQQTDTVICFCTGITVGQVIELRDHGFSHDSIILQTGASQHCGSCTQRVAAITRAQQAGEIRTASAPKPIWPSIIVALSCVVLAVLALYLPFADTWQSRWRLVDYLWRDGLAKQISGYLSLSLILTALWSAWRRRGQRLRQERQSLAMLSWHLTLAIALIACFIVHTGMRVGSGLNALLAFLFLATALVGALVSLGWLQAAKNARMRAFAQGVRTLHWVLLFPIPAVLLFHIMKVYYF